MKLYLCQLEFSVCISSRTKWILVGSEFLSAVFQLVPTGKLDRYQLGISSSSRTKCIWYQQGDLICTNSNCQLVPSTSSVPSAYETKFIPTRIISWYQQQLSYQVDFLVLLDKIVLRKNLKIKNKLKFYFRWNIQKWCFRFLDPPPQAPWYGIWFKEKKQ